MKYRLIKEYPGSPKLGTIAEKVGDIKYTYPDGTIKYASSAAESLFYNIISCNPEYWQEVVEKDYEILSISSGNKILNDSNVKTWEKFKGFRGAWNIHSVKRLSDGEIFTIGDKIFPNNKIYKFELKNDILTIWHCDISFSTPVIKGPSGQPGNCSWIKGIDNLKKLKQPLFTTEDGVDKYEGEEYYYLHKHSFRIDKAVAYKRFIDVNTTGLYFSTIEAAEEYALMNKPKYSLNDILISLPNKHCEKYVSIKNMITNLKNM